MENILYKSINFLDIGLSSNSWVYLYCTFANLVPFIWVMLSGKTKVRETAVIKRRKNVQSVSNQIKMSASKKNLHISWTWMQKQYLSMLVENTVVCLFLVDFQSIRQVQSNIQSNSVSPQELTHQHYHQLWKCAYFYKFPCAPTTSPVALSSFSTCHI